jgi:protein involved in polysaccharide export with SLBB domain
VRIRRLLTAARLRTALAAALAAGLAGCASSSPKTAHRPPAPPSGVLSTRLSVGPSTPAPVRPAAAPATPAARPPASVTNRSPAVTSTGAITGEVIYRLKPGDPVVVYLRGIMPHDEQHEDRVDENGMIKLTHIGLVRAAGRTTAELEDAIERAYIDQQIYRQVYVSVVTPEQGCFVQGEVKEPGAVPMASGLTLLQAIAAARGYSEFADPTKIRVTRGRQVLSFNALEIEKKPERDPKIEPGDVIVVPRKWY